MAYFHLIFTKKMRKPKSVGNTDQKNCVEKKTQLPITVADKCTQQEARLSI